MMSDGVIVEIERVPVSVAAGRPTWSEETHGRQMSERIPPRKTGGDWITANKKEVKPVPLKRREVKPLPEGLDPDKLVKVCSKCLTACCAQFATCCKDVSESDDIQMTVQELWELGREHWNYWK